MTTATVEDKRICYRVGYKYVTARDHVFKVAVHPELLIVTPFIRLGADGTLWIQAGYAWDGPSGPTIDTPDSMRGSLVHDALYQLMREGFLDRKLWREPADVEMRRIMLEDGMLPARAEAWFMAVRAFAEHATMPSAARELVAP